MYNNDEISDDKIINADEKRGGIQNLDRYKQLIDFTGLIRQGKKTPTDIDGLIDYNGNAFLFIEGKSKGKRMPDGQKLAFSNLIRTLKKAGIYAEYIVFEHEEPVDKIIYSANKIVTEYCSTDMDIDEMGWKVPDNSLITVKEYVEKFEKISIERNIDIVMYKDIK